MKLVLSSTYSEEFSENLPQLYYKTHFEARRIIFIKMQFLHTSLLINTIYTSFFESLYAEFKKNLIVGYLSYTVIVGNELEFQAYRSLRKFGFDLQ